MNHFAYRLDVVARRALPSAPRVGGLGWRRLTGYTIRACDSRTTPASNARWLVAIRDATLSHGYMTADR